MQVDSITIPVGPRLGDKVLEVSGVNKGFGDRLLVDGMTFSVPPGQGCRDKGGRAYRMRHMSAGNLHHFLSLSQLLFSGVR